MLIVILLGVSVWLKNKSFKSSNLKSKTYIRFPEVYTYEEFENEIMKLVNEHRTQINLNALQTLDYISYSCKEHNIYMETTGVASHDNFVSRSENIILATGATRVGENVAYNYSTPKSTISAWLKSTSHKKNLESSDWTHMGVANQNKFTTNIFIEK